MLGTLAQDLKSPVQLPSLVPYSYEYKIWKSRNVLNTKLVVLVLVRYEFSGLLVLKSFEFWCLQVRVL